MTLCAAWLRRELGDDGTELVFATDSRLTGGEDWDYGIKLFDLGRSDCLLCFAGSTARAYPLLLHGANSPRFNVSWQDPRLDVYDVLEILTSLFTDLCLEIRTDVGRDKHELRGEAQFLFGGWSWRQQHFGVWRLYYSTDLEAFTHESFHEDHDLDRLYVFIGDHQDAAQERLGAALKNAGKEIRGAFDMEPLVVLAQMARDQVEYRAIGGALQVAKVYRSGNNEFFGVLWPSIAGRPSMLGRTIRRYEAPPTRLLDPDTGQLIDQIPSELPHPDRFDFGDESRFVTECYPSGRLKTELSQGRRQRLERIFQDTAYRQFIGSLGSEVVREADSSEAVMAEEAAETGDAFSTASADGQTGD